MQANGHDRTVTAQSIEALAQQARQEDYQRRAMPLMLQTITQQRNAALDQLGLAHAELAMLRAEHDKTLMQNAEHQTAIEALRADLAALNEKVDETATVANDALVAAGAGDVIDATQT